MASCEASADEKFENKVSFREDWARVLGRVSLRIMFISSVKISLGLSLPLWGENSLNNSFESFLN